jgi:hypothetical protein
MRAAAPSLATLFVAAAVAAQAQVPGPPLGGPSGQFLGAPAGNARDFLGSWQLSWDGPIDSGCPCSGTLLIKPDEDVSDGFEGYWAMKGPDVLLRGRVSYDQTVWVGRFVQAGDMDFPLRGHFRFEARDSRTLTGSYHPDGTAIPFRWSARR